jgi:L-aminopeptidase/D-esterase-like protein
MRIRWLVLPLLLLFTMEVRAQSNDALARPRARALGVPFDGTPGPLNAITDVPGVEIGNTTLISGSGTPDLIDKAVRTGVTVILPRGKQNADPVYAGWFSLNGNGEMTGTAWVGMP